MIYLLILPINITWDIFYYDLDTSIMSKRDPNTVKVLKLARFQTCIAKLLREFSLPLTPERDEIIIDIQLQLVELQALFNYLPTGLTIERSDKAWSLLALLPHELISNYKDFLNFLHFVVFLLMTV